MRLCFIAPLHSVHTQRWLNAFVERGHEVHLITLPGDAGDLRGLTLHRLPAGRPRIRFAQWVLAARQLLRGIHPDVLHGHYLTRYGWLAAATFFHPLVLTAWGTDAYVDPRRSQVTHWLTNQALRRADLVTADAADLRQRVIALGAHSKRTHLIQWGVDLNVFRPDLDTAALRLRLGVGPGPVLLSTRGLLPNYNQDCLVRALPAVISAAPEARLIIKYNEYEPGYLARLQALVAELGLEQAVRFVGAEPYSEMARYYALADIFISAASSDSTPVSLLEAMASGAAPVVSNLPALGEWITDGENGYQVPPRDEAALAQAIQHLLQSAERRRQFARLNRQIVEKRANHSVEMQRVEELYAALVRPASRLGLRPK